MRKLLLAFALLVFASTARAQTATVTGTLRDASGTAVTSNAFARFELQNFQPSSIPRVSGSGVVVSTLKDFSPNGSGAISGTIYRNDNITPAGTWWRVCTYFGGTRRNCYRFNITGASFDLDSATPIDTDPVVTAPTGDTTYLRLDGGNLMSGDVKADSAIRNLGTVSEPWNLQGGMVDVAHTFTPQGRILLTGIESPAQITSNQDNYDPGNGNTLSTIWRLSSNASRDITGFGGAAPVAGRIVYVVNVGAQNIVLKNESASSTAANRLALNADVTLGANQSAIIWYDNTSARWRVLARY